MSSFSDTMAETDIVRKPKAIYMEDERPIKEFFKFLYEYFEVADKWVEMQRFSIDHPVASVFLIVTLAAFAVPVIAFLIFVVSSVVFSFLGFFLFEGTILAVGIFVLGGILFFVGLFAIGFSLFLVGGYYVLEMARSVLMGIKEKIKWLVDEQEKEE